MNAQTRQICRFALALALFLAPFSLLAQTAELFLQSMDAPSGVFQQGDSITIQSSTLNIGDAASGAYTITFYASDDLSYSEDDAPIATQERPSLPIGVSDTTPVNGAIPLNLTPG